MKISKVKLKNWMIFRGEQEIQFSTDKANITVIYGENMHGKTSLLNAIRWCLYGSALNRQAKAIHSAELINSKAYGAGDRQVEVSVFFTVEQKSYEIWRSIDFNGDTPSVSVGLKIDGRAIDAGKITQEIENVVPEQISQFMLFDGELLRQFEDLVVSEGSPQAAAIKNAIEKTLGIPEIKLAHHEAAELVRELKRQGKAQFDRDQRSKLLADKHAELDQKLEIKISEKEKIELAIEQFSTELIDLTEQLQKSERALVFIDRVSEGEKRLKELKERQSDTQAAIKDLTSDLWLYPLRQAIQPLVKEYTQQLELLQRQQEATASKSLELLRLKTSIQSSSCHACKTPLGSAELDRMRERIEALEMELSPEIDYDEMQFKLRSSLHALKFLPHLDPNPSKYLAEQSRDADLEKDILDLENDLYELRQQLQDVDEDASLSVRRSYEAVLQESAVQKFNLERCKQDITDLESELKRIRKSDEFAKLSQDSDILQQIDRAENLKEVLNTAIQNYTDKMRIDIQSRATDTFSNLTTEQTFDTLEINENYGLNLIVDGKKVNRSAGAEQIVAMSLIEALNHLGRIKGPMIMDTPVGRLDAKHRKNILDYLPTVVTQLAIFAHSGELSEGSKLLNPNYVGKRYRINRVSTFEARIEEL